MKKRYTFNCKYGKYLPDGQPHELEEEVAQKLLKDDLITLFQGVAEKNRSKEDLKIAISFVHKAIGMAKDKVPDGFEEFLERIE